MSKRFLVLLLALVILSSVACSRNKNPTEPEKIDEFGLITKVGDTYFTNYTTPSGLGVNIGISDVFTNLVDGNTSNDPFIIDYRSAAYFATGHIKGAHNIALTSLMDKVDDGTIPKDKTILNICYTGQSASYATCVLNLLRYNAQNLLFGMCGVTTDSTIRGTSKWLSQVATDDYR